MSKILFIDYDETLHDTGAKFAALLDGIYGLPSEQLIEIYVSLHRNIVHVQYPKKHDDFHFHQKLICDHIGRPYNEDEALEMAERFKVAQEECWINPWFFPECFDFLDKAKEKHILCLTTGDCAPEKAEALTNASGRDHFSYIFDDKELGLKGDSTYFRNALLATNSFAGDAVAIGDSLDHDIIPAKKLGIATIWINRRGLSPLPNDLLPDYEARDLVEALVYLDQLDI